MKAIDLNYLLDELDFTPREERKVRSFIIYELSKTVKNYAKRKPKTTYHLDYKLKRDEFDVRHRIDGTSLSSIKNEAYTAVLCMLIEDLVYQKRDKNLIEQIKLFVAPYQKEDASICPYYIFKLSDQSSFILKCHPERNKVLFKILKLLIET